VALADADGLALADVEALADAEAADELAATTDDAAALAETGADDEATPGADAADAAGAEKPGAEAAGAACLLEVHAASSRLPPRMATSARRCPITSSVPTSGLIITPRLPRLSDVYGALDLYTSDNRRPDASKGP
jgi:hypothetical protein